MTIVLPSAEIISKAADFLRGGELVAFPTETVYGLGGDATQDSAVEKIYAAKGRPSFNPLIVHVGAREWVAGIAEPDGRFDKLARTFWPGPLTLVMHRRSDSPISKIISAGRDTVAVRMPDHDVAREILKATRRPLAAPSANRSGFVSPTSAQHVLDGLDTKPALIIDGGQCRVGVESTVLDLTQHIPAILRPGSITREQIEAAIGEVTIGIMDPTAPKAPGQLLSHYAPGLPVRLNVTSPEPGEAFIGFGPLKGSHTLSMAGDLDEAAANLFAALRAADNLTLYKGIAVAPIPETGIGVAINDRLRRAAAPRNTTSV
ncbi:MAG: threonylcarbamoyl-AMP synthase [Rhodospirillaceae bacterium]|nr:threonylcarbamoyl-AMP synthase [Rhodospirillaceae bacterium]